MDIQPPPSPISPMLQTLSSPRSNRVLKWLVLAALILFIGTIASFWFGGTSFSEKDVVLLVEGPTQAFSGDEITYRVHYRNNTKVTLKDLDFRFFYPEDSIVITADGYTHDTSVGFTLEKLSPGQEGVQEFRVFLIGDKGTIREARTNLVFHAGTLRSSFEKSASVATTIVGLPVPMTLSAPPTAVSGQEIQYILDYRNESGADISDVQFEFTYPDGFTVRQASPAPSSPPALWNIPLVRQGAGSRIVIRGVLAGGEGENKNVSVALRRKLNGQYVDYEEAASSTAISSPLLNVAITVNGTRDYAASVGDLLDYKIQYKNSSNFDLTGLSLVVKLDGDMYDFGTLDTRGGFFDASSRTILWNAGSIPDFADLLSGRGGSTGFRLRLKPSFSGALGSKTFFVRATATVSTPNVPTGLDGDQVSTQDVLTTKISIQPTLNPLLYYDDPAFGASGPMPPEVGKETLFTVHWQVANPGNDVANAQVKAILPPGVTWKNVVSSAVGQPQPVFDRNASTVIWNIGTLSAGTGVGASKYEVSFQVGATASLLQRNTAMLIIKPATFSGTDTFTKQAILVTTGELTSNDTQDRQGAGTVQ